MPQVGNKHFSYTKAGYKAARKAKKRIGKKSYSTDVVKMARRMYG